MFGRVGSRFKANKTLLIAGIGCSLVGFYLASKSVFASFGYAEDSLPLPSYPWEHKSIFSSFDHAAIRRGFQVYNNIGSACHAMKYRYYRQLIDVAYTEDEVKEIAASKEDYDSPPNDEGDVLKRTGVPNDRFWEPYKNEKEARAANEGALPPDLSQIVRSRTGGEDYIMALMTGYRDPPHGVKLGENMYYNPYFPGSQLAMPPPLSEGAVTYDDGTHASVSQMAKDVSVFLTWSSFMEQDERHLMGIKTIACLTAIVLPLFYWKKVKFNVIKKRSVSFLRRKSD